MIRLDSGALLHLLRNVLVMRQWMMRFRNANLWIRPSILFAAIHKGGHAGQVRLEGQQLQVVEKAHMRLEPIGNTFGPRHIRRGIAGWPALRALFFGLLDSSFDVSKG